MKKKIQLYHLISSLSSHRAVISVIDWWQMIIDQPSKFSLWFLFVNEKFSELKAMFNIDVAKPTN